MSELLEGTINVIPSMEIVVGKIIYCLLGLGVGARSNGLRSLGAWLALCSLRRRSKPREACFQYEKWLHVS